VVAILAAHDAGLAAQLNTFRERQTQAARDMTLPPAA
jgi:phosphoribosylcarboxyaminoimidazole (NCAIR) mutase